MYAIDPVRWAALSPKIDELLLLGQIERQQRLDALAVSDPSTANEVRALLRARDDASDADFLAVPAASELLPIGAVAGDRLGAWTLVDLIGEGGMGTVWRARRNDGRFDGEAAVKLLRSGLFDATAQERFRREGAILSRLRRPGIAQLLDAGITPQQQPYMVLELVHGERIDRWCDARGLGPRERIELFLQVLDAVGAAHSQLVIHRDLKPSNILVDDAGRVTLLDFGIAHLLPEADRHQTALTREGTAGLTPRYAAPEQFQSGAVSMSTDVYALGIVLYELLTHAHPCGMRGEPTALTYMQSAIEGRHVTASSATSEKRRDLRGDVDTMLAKACAVEPRDRYLSAVAMREDIQRHLANEPIAARRASAWYRLAKLVRRRPFESAALVAIVAAIPAGAHVQAVVLVSFAAGTGVALWQLRRAREQAAMARAEKRRAEAVTQFIASTFCQAIPREGAGGVVTAADLLHSAHIRVRSELQGEPLVAAELLGIVADSFNELGDLVAASEVLPEAVALRERVLGWAHPSTLHARTAMAHVQVVRGELQAAERTLPRLLEDLRAAMPGSAADLTAALRHRSYVLTKRGEVEPAIADLHEALAVAREHFGEASRHTLTTQALLGNTLSTFGRDSDAIAVLEPAVQTARKLFAAQRPRSELAELEGFLAASLIGAGRLGEAEDLLRHVLADQLALDGRETLRIGYTRNMLAIVRANRGAMDEAIVLMREALSAQARLTPAPTVDAGTMTAQLGEMLVEAGQFDVGLATIEQAESIVTAAGGAGQEFSAIRRGIRRAHALLVAGRFEAALREAASVFDRTHDSTSWIAAVALRVQVGSLRALSRLEDAEALVEQLLERVENSASTAGNKARTYLELAALRIEQGRQADGAAMAHRAVELLLPTQVPESVLLLRARRLLDDASR